MVRARPAGPTAGQETAPAVSSRRCPTACCRPTGASAGPLQHVVDGRPPATERSNPGIVRRGQRPQLESSHAQRTTSSSPHPGLESRKLPAGAPPSVTLVAGVTVLAPVAPAAAHAAADHGRPTVVHRSDHRVTVSRRPASLLSRSWSAQGRRHVRVVTVLPPPTGAAQAAVAVAGRNPHRGAGPTRRCPVDARGTRCVSTSPDDAGGLSPRSTGSARRDGWTALHTPDGHGRDRCSETGHTGCRDDGLRNAGSPPVACAGRWLGWPAGSLRSSAPDVGPEGALPVGNALPPVPRGTPPDGTELTPGSRPSAWRSFWSVQSAGARPSGPAAGAGCSCAARRRRGSVRS